MNEKEMALIEKLLENQKDLLDALNCVAESQYLIAQALTPKIQIVVVVADDEPPTRN